MEASVVFGRLALTNSPIPTSATGSRGRRADRDDGEPILARRSFRRALPKPLRRHREARGERCELPLLAAEFPAAGARGVRRHQEPPALPVSCRAVAPLAAFAAFGRRMDAGLGRTARFEPLLAVKCGARAGQIRPASGRHPGNHSRRLPWLVAGLTGRQVGLWMADGSGRTRVRGLLCGFARELPFAMRATAGGIMRRRQLWFLHFVHVSHFPVLTHMVPLAQFATQRARHPWK
jgi:hypothetical protein